MNFIDRQGISASQHRI